MLRHDEAFGGRERGTPEYRRTGVTARESAH